MDNIVSASFSLTSDIVGSDWIKVDQVTEADVLAKSELAELIDAVFGVTPCIVNSDSIKEPQRSALNPLIGAEDFLAPLNAPPIEEKEDFDFFIQKHFDLTLCDLLGEGSYRTKVQVIVSDVVADNNYVLRLTNGRLDGSATTIREEVTYTIEVNDSSGATLQYPVVGDKVEVEWIDTPVSKTLGRIEPIAVVGEGAVNWGVDVTGTIQLTYLTKYDLVPVIVFGNPDGSDGQSEAIGFYRELESSTTLSAPDYDEEDLENGTESSYCDAASRDPIGGSTTIGIVTDIKCYRLETPMYYCQCSGSLSHLGPERKVYTACPERQGCGNGATTCEVELSRPSVFGGYVNCGETDEVSNPDYYEHECCEELPEKASLPICKDLLTNNPGGFGLSDETIQRYRREYPNVRFTGILPEDGDCGTITYRQVIPQRSCCDNPPSLYFIKTVDTVEWDSQYIFSAGGGVPPYYWSTQGPGLSITGHNTYATLITNNCFCSPGQVIVTDSCGQSVSHEVSPVGECEESLLEYDDENSAQVIADDSAGRIVTTGGTLPLTVSLSGEGFFLDSAHTLTEAVVGGNNFTVYTADACGFCEVAVTDKCGQTTSGSTKSTNGEWVNTGEDCLDYKGIKATEYESVYGASYGMAYQGNLRIRQRVAYTLGNQGSYLTPPPCSTDVVWQDLFYANVFCEGHSGRWVESGCVSFDVTDPFFGKTGATQDDCGYCLFTEQIGENCWYETMRKDYGAGFVEEWKC